MNLSRTHLFKHDLDWLPASLKAVRWVVAGSVWTGASALAIGAATGSPGIMGGVAKGIFVGGLYAGDRAARRVLRWRLTSLAHGQVALNRLKQEADGELLHVRGRVRARTVIPGLLDDGAPAVYRRVEFTLGDVRMVHDAAVDFALVDDQGELVIVQVSDARLVAPHPKLRRWAGGEPEVERLLLLPLPKQADRWLKARARRLNKGRSLPRVAASEFLLRDGDEIEVVGYKNRVVDASVESRLGRDTPERATLRAGRALPLILSPARPRVV